VTAELESGKCSPGRIEGKGGVFKPKSAKKVSSVFAAILLKIEAHREKSNGKVSPYRRRGCTTEPNANQLGFVLASLE